MISHKEGIKAVPFVPPYLLCLREETVVTEVAVGVDVHQYAVGCTVYNGVAWEGDKDDQKKKRRPEAKRQRNTDEPREEGSSEGVSVGLALKEIPCQHQNRSPYKEGSKLSDRSNGPEVEQERSNQRLKQYSDGRNVNRETFSNLSGQGIHDGGRLVKAERKDEDQDNERMHSSIPDKLTVGLHNEV